MRLLHLQKCVLLLNSFLIKNKIINTNHYLLRVEALRDGLGSLDRQSGPLRQPQEEISISRLRPVLYGQL